MAEKAHRKLVRYDSNNAVLVAARSSDLIEKQVDFSVSYEAPKKAITND